jgi:hypothetical protein
LNVVVTQRDGEERARRKFFVPYTRETHVPKRWSGGDYDDVVVATDAGRRFASRACTVRSQFTPRRGADPTAPADVVAEPKVPVDAVK